LSPDRIALNPDCGFAPDAGEPPTIEEAYAKLRRLVAAASKLREQFHPAPGVGAAPSPIE
jgi:methionine synthase II (cobalamin-independent)